jgi:Glycosyl hydrolase family 12
MIMQLATAVTAAVTLLGAASPASAHAVLNNSTTCYSDTGTTQYPITQSDGSAAFFSNDQYGPQVPLESCIPAGAAGYTVESSSVGQSGPPYDAPDAYVDDAVGCIWEDNACSTGWSDIPTATFRSSSPVHFTFSATPDTTSSDVWDLAEDAFFLPKGTMRCDTCDQDEVMIQFDMHGDIVPAQAEIAKNVTIGGNTYNVWFSGDPTTVGLLSFQLTSYVTAINDLDFSPLVKWGLNHDDSSGAPYITSGWTLNYTALGNELWVGGAGSQMNSDLISYPAAS